MISDANLENNIPDFITKSDNFTFNINDIEIMQIKIQRVIMEIQIKDKENISPPSTAMSANHYQIFPPTDARKSVLSHPLQQGKDQYLLCYRHRLLRHSLL